MLHESQRTRAAADGSALEFGSAIGFGDVRGTGIVAEYISRRDGAPGANGWTTHAITPGGLRSLSAFDTALGGLDPRYMGEFSPDLSRGVFLSDAALAGGSSFTAGPPGIYLRDDMLTPGAGHYQLLSDCPACAAPLPTSPADQPAFAGASADYSHVLFESTQSLTSEVAPCNPGPFGAACPIRLYEWAKGAVRLAGVLPDGSAAPRSQAGRGAMYALGFNTSYTPGVISQDGSRIFFTVVESGRLAGELYMRVGNDTPAPSTVQINASERTALDAPQPATFWTATPDGSKAFFTTDESLIDGSPGGLYMYDANAPAGHHLTLISVDNEPSDGVGATVDGVIGVSDDGSYVYFIAQGQLEAGKPTTNADRMFVWHDGVVREIGDVTPDLLSILGSGSWRLTPKTGRVSPDGTHLVFTAVGGTAELPHSGAGETCAAFNGTCEEAYVYDATANGGTGQLVCASCHPGDPNAPSQTDATFVARDQAAGSPVLNRPLSDDGRFVFFTTGDRLVAEDHNDVNDVYEYDTTTGQTHLLSSGAPGSLGSSFLDASASGHDAFFATRDQLVGWDTDEQVDVYDARIDGGFPDPPPALAPCVGDTCHDPGQAARSFAPAASSTVAGGGNVHAKKKPKAPKRCARGRVRRRVHGRVRCVKRAKSSRRTHASRKGR